jgi:hypothetical protein
VHTKCSSYSLKGRQLRQYTCRRMIFKELDINVYPGFSCFWLKSISAVIISLPHLASSPPFCKKKSSFTIIKAKLFILRQVYFYICLYFSFILIVTGISCFRDFMSYPAGRQAPRMGHVPSVEKHCTSGFLYYGSSLSCSTKEGIS